MEQRISEHYLITDELLGRGGMGSVFRGRDVRTGKTVAIKALHSIPGVEMGSLAARFQREGMVLQQLNHPNIVSLLDVVTQQIDGPTASQSAHYLVMEHVPGGSLADLLEKGPLPVQRALEIGLDLSDALTRTHRLGIIHRDIKPANVLLAADGTPRLSDFGTAAMLAAEHLTSSGMIIGTVAYLSPEACNGEELDARTDIWGFGVLLYEMLTGDLPFNGTDLVSTLQAILSQRVPDLEQLRPDLPAGLVDLIYRMLEKERQARLPSIRLAGAEIESLLKGDAAAYQVVLRDTPGNLPALPRSDSPGIPTPAKKHNNLPSHPTPLIGRQGELAQLETILGSSNTRLVTIVGSGGMGKTRLALATGERLLDRYADGVCFVALANLERPDEIITASASALGFQFQEGVETPRQQLVSALRERQLLLILDNFEHLIPGANLVAEIVAAAPGVQILVTSRVDLNLYCEQRFPLTGLDLPADLPDEPPESPAAALRFSAIQLFMQGARRASPGFELLMADLKAILRICQLVQGMPLGILLAAAWVEMLRPEEIASEITRDLDFLSSDSQDMPARHQSMRAVFEYSWRLLPPDEQQVFARLAVFRSGFSRQAAQEVTGISLRQLMNLVSRSLLLRSHSGRFQIHELLRQFAAEKLGPTSSQVEEAHTRHYLTLLAQQGVLIQGPEPLAGLETLQAERDNLRQAVEWAAAQGWFDSLYEALDYLLVIFYMRFSLGAYTEQIVVLLNLVTKVRPAPGNRLSSQAMQAVLLAHQSYSEFIIGSGSRSRSSLLATQSKALVANLPPDQFDGLSTSLWRILLAYGGMDLPEDDSNKAWLEQALSQMRTSGDPGRLTYTLILAGIASGVYYKGLNRPLLSLLQEAIQLAQAQGEIIYEAIAVGTQAYLSKASNEQTLNQLTRCLQVVLDYKIQNGAMMLLNLLSGIYDRMGDYASAAHYYQLAADTAHQGGSLRDEMLNLPMVALMEMRLGELDRSLQTRQKALVMQRAANELMSLGWGLWEIGDLYRLKGDCTTAQSWYEQARSVFEQTNNVHGLGFYYRGHAEVALAQGDLEKASKMLQQATLLARESNHEWLECYVMRGLAQLALRRGDHRALTMHLQQGIKLSLEIQYTGLTMYLFTTAAEALVTFGKPTEAARVLACVAAHKSSWAESRQAAKLMLADFGLTAPAEVESVEKLVEQVVGWLEAIQVTSQHQ